MKNNVLKVKNEHLIFKTSIIRVKPYLLVDNKSKTELIDKFFVRANKISIFKLEKLINLTLKNSKVVQQLSKKTFVNITIRDYIKHMICYLAKLDVYTVILDDR